MRCPACPVPPDRPCYSAVVPDFCEWAASGDPVKVAHVVNRSRIAEGQPAPQPPGLLSMAASAATAAAAFVASGCALASDHVYRERLRVCGGCEHWTGSRCLLCGCFTAAKARTLEPSCPAGKWPALDPLPE